MAFALPPYRCMRCGMQNDLAFGLDGTLSALCSQCAADEDAPPVISPRVSLAPVARIETLGQALLALRAVHHDQWRDARPLPLMLGGPVEPPEQETRAEYDNVIDAFLANPDLHDVQFDRIYSPQRRSYGFRGPYEYFKPAGWSHFAIRVPDFDQIKRWPVAYHGTSTENAPSILMRGLRPPGEPGVERQHGAAGAQGRATIYLSKSVCLPVYSKLLEMQSRAGGYVQIVFKCRVRPGTFQEQRNTLGRTYWDPQLRMDPDHPDNDSMEWLFTSPDDIRLTGLLLREFGPEADASRYGELVQQLVGPFDRGPEYKWTELLQEERRRCGHYVERGNRQRGRRRAQPRAH